MKINLFPLALIFLVKKLPPDTGGCANGPVVRLLEKYKEDEGILKHELEHVKQYWFLAIVVTLIILGLSQYFHFNPYYAVAGVGTHSFLYLFVKPYRYWAELKAYAVQLQYSQDKEKDVVLFGSFIANYYDLNVSETEATVTLKVFSEEKTKSKSVKYE